jgi:hypothetical protein
MLLVSAFLTWTTLNYFIQPRQVLQTIQQLGAAVRRAPFKAVAKSFRRLKRPNTLHVISESNS